ncbi:MAG: thioredoxin family protein [Muribaculaceae bacterium]|nr:thioredoxin family protein [Muribaculaceae bacterium]
MNNKILIIAILGLITLTGQAQNHLPRFKYSKEPAVLSGSLVGDSTQRPEDIEVIHWMKYNPGLPGEAIKGNTASLDENGYFSFKLHTGTTAKCLVTIGNYKFTCYIVPGDTVSFVLDLDKIKTQGLSQSLSFSGTLSELNHDIVYAMEKGFDPEALYQKIEMKRNMGQLVNELSDVSIDGYFQYLDSTYQCINKRIDEDRNIGDAYREFAKAANHYEYGCHVPFCAYSIKYAGLDTEEQFAALVERQSLWLENYMKNDPWTDPALCYVMWGYPEIFIDDLIKREVKLPEDYRQCYLASKYMMQIGQQSKLLSEAQKDSLRVYLPELGQDILDYNDKLEQEMAFINESGKSRICTLPNDKIVDNDVLSAILEPYRGFPVLLDLWETTCGQCRVAFKQMHEKKIELADKIHFVNIASERSDRATWELLVPNYIGDHYLLTDQQLKSLHSQLPCDTNVEPLWILINSDGTIHHTFHGWGNLDIMMKELEPVLQ